MAGRTGTTVFGAASIMAALFALIATPCPAITVAAVDAIVKPIMGEAKIPGLAVSVSDGEGKLIDRTYGFANLEHQIPVSSGTVFEIGSVTKIFTAIGILMLQEEGRLSVEDKLSKYFLEYPRGDEITLKHLLQHTSGIREILAVDPFGSNQEKDWKPQEVVKMLEPFPLDFEPGEHARYSNSGCMLLGLVIEKVSGSAYGDFISERIMKPLGMTNTLAGSNSEIVPGRVAGYELKGPSASVSNAPYVSLIAPFASGGVISTASDLVRLKKAFQRGMLLKGPSIAEMIAPAVLRDGKIFEDPDSKMSFGYCLEILKFGDISVPGKTGGISGFNAYFAYLPQKNIMVAATANLANSLPALLKICLSILQES